MFAASVLKIKHSVIDGLSYQTKIKANFISHTKKPTSI